jgi:tetratricopeptide (TPR) repeat protein
MTSMRVLQNGATESQRKFLAAFVFSLIAVACLTTWAYRPALDGPFILDDKINIVDSPALRWSEISAENILLVLDSSLLGSRPVSNVSFALDHLASGLDPRAFHATNISIHIAVGLVLLWLSIVYTSVTASSSKVTDTRWAIAIFALMSVALFLLHPLNTQAVTYIVQRMASLAALFTLISFACYLTARYRLTARPKLWYVAAALAWLLGLGSKENAVLLLPVLMLYELCFFRAEWRCKIEQLTGGTWGRQWTLLAWIGSTTLLLMVGILVVMLSDSFGLFNTFQGRDYNGWERLLTQCRVQIFHLSQLFWPAPGRLNLDHDFSVSRGLLSPKSTLLAVIACLLLIVGALILAIRNPRYGFPVLAYFTFHSLEAGPVNLEIIFEHRMYLPMAMLVLLGPALLADAGKRRRLVILTALVAFAAIFASWTHTRNEVWADPLGLSRDMAHKSPNKVRTQYNYANALSNDGRLEDALPVIRGAIVLDPSDSTARGLLGQILLRLGRSEEAIIAYKESIQLEPEDVRSVMGLGEALGAVGREDAALQHYLEAGSRFARGGRPWEAIMLLESSVSSYPGSADIRNLLGNSYMTAGMPGKAIDQFRKAVELNGGMFEAWFNLGVTAEALGYRNEAIKAYRTFLEHAPAGLQQPIMRARERIRALSPTGN